MTTDERDAFAGWMILELMGHRKLAGQVSEQEIAGSSFLRIDVYAGTAPEPCATQFYSAAAVYCMTPTTEELARQMATSHTPRPVTRYELPAAAPTDGEDADELPY